MITETQADRRKSNIGTNTDKVLDVRNLRVSYRDPRGPVRAVNGVSFFLKPGERLGLGGRVRFG